MRSTTLTLATPILLLSILIVFQFIKFSFLEIETNIEIKDNRHVLSKFYTQSGQPFNEEDIDINRPTLVMFFDPDCADCNNMMRKILKYYSEFDSLNLLLITEADISRLKQFIKKHEIKGLSNMTFLFDNNEVMYKDYGIVSVPSFVLYDSKLKLEKKIIEPFDFISLVFHVRKEINKKSQKNF